MRGQSPVTPEQAGAGAWARLARLNSFGFTLSFHTDVPFPIEVRFTGKCELPDREVWTGYMRRRTDVSRVELRAEGPDQYEKEGSSWRRTMRGIKTRVLEQGEGAFRGKSLVFAGTEHGRYQFTFNPDLPILDPTRMKKLKGVMEVDPHSGLPVRLYCADSARTAEWELRLGRFNRAGSVVVPYQPAMTVEARPARALSRAEFGGAVGILNERLAKLGWDCRLRRTGSALTLLLGQSKSHRQVEWLFSRGDVGVWQGRWAGVGDPQDSVTALEVGGDAARRVVLVQLLGGNGQLGETVRAETPLAARLEVSVAVPDTTGPAVLVVDGRALSAAMPGLNGKLLFSDIGSEDDVRVIAALVAFSTMPAGFNATIKP